MFNGIVTFLTAPDFEAPTDANHDNVYEVIVTTASDVEGRTDSQTLRFTITDVVYPVANVFIGTSGNVTVEDKLDRANEFSLTRIGTDIVISDTSIDPDYRFVVADTAPGTLSPNAKTVSIPLAAINNVTAKPLIVGPWWCDDILQIDTNQADAAAVMANVIPTKGLSIVRTMGSIPLISCGTTRRTFGDSPVPKEARLR